MEYEIGFRPQAIRDFRGLSPEVAQRISDKITLLSHDLTGDVKRLKHFEPKYRLRVGDWRVLFEISGNSLQIWRVRHRRDVYDG